MGWEDVGTVIWAWVPWTIGVLGALFGVSGHLRAARAEKRAHVTYEAPPWEDARHESGDLFTIKNASPRDVIVTAVEAEPSERTALLSFLNTFPYTIYAGDSLGVLAEARFSLARPDVVIQWRFSDSERLRKSRRILPSDVS